MTFPKSLTRQGPHPSAINIFTTAFQSEGRLFFAPVCGIVSVEVIRLTDVVAALIWDQGKFMICQRPAHKTRGQLWEFVGGKTEPGETMTDALIRECREELDIAVCPGEIFTQVVHEYPDILIRLTLFHCTIAEGEPKLLEHADIRWICPAEISDYEFCPADKDILALIRKKYR